MNEVDRLNSLLHAYYEQSAGGITPDILALTGNDPELSLKLSNLIAAQQGKSISDFFERQPTHVAIETSAAQPKNSMQPRSNPELVIHKLGRYEIIRKIGKGGMGDVYLASDPRLDREVAIKVARLRRDSDLDGLILKRFLAEVKTAAKISHPNACKIHDVDVAGEHPFVVMDYIDGVSLQQAIDKKPYKRIEAIYKLILPILDVLEMLHHSGIIHRDIKPGNILLDRKNNSYLTDFGLAKLTNTNQKLTESGIIVGTPAYMPPEQFSPSSMTVDHRADIYSISAVMFEMLAGKRVYEGTTHQIMMKQVANQPNSLRELRPDIDQQFIQLIEKGLSTEPNDRYRSAKEFANCIRDYFKRTRGSSVHAALNITANTQRETTSLKQATNKKKYIVAGIGMIFFLTLFLAFLFNRQKKETVQEDTKKQIIETVENKLPENKNDKLIKKVVPKQVEPKQEKKEKLEVAPKPIPEPAPKMVEHAVINEQPKPIEMNSPQLSQPFNRFSLPGGKDWVWETKFARGSIIGVATDLHSKKIAMGGSDPTIRILDTDTFELLDAFQLELIDQEKPSAICSIAWSPDGKKLALGCLDGSIRIYDALTHQRSQYFRQPNPTDHAGIYPGVGQSITWSANGRYLLSVGGVAVLFDLAKKQPVHVEEAVGDFCWSPSGNFLFFSIYANPKNKGVIYDVVNNKRSTVIELNLQPLGVQDDGKTVVAHEKDSNEFWEVDFKSQNKKSRLALLEEKDFVDSSIENPLLYFYRRNYVFQIRNNQWKFLYRPLFATFGYRFGDNFQPIHKYSTRAKFMVLPTYNQRNVEFGPYATDVTRINMETKLNFTGLETPVFQFLPDLDGNSIYIRECKIGDPAIVKVDLQTGQLQDSFGTMHPKVSRFYKHPLEELFFGSAADNRYLWHRAKGEVKSWDILVQEPKFSPNGDTVLMNYNNSKNEATLALYNLPLKSEPKWKINKYNAVRQPWSSDQKRVLALSATADKIVELDAESGTELASYVQPTLPKENVNYIFRNVMYMNGCKSILAFLSNVYIETKPMVVFDISTKKAQIYYLSKDFELGEMVPDFQQKRIFNFSTYSGKCCIIDLATQKRVEKISLIGSPIHSVVHSGDFTCDAFWSMDGSRLFLASRSSLTELDAKTLAVQRVLIAHPGNRFHVIDKKGNMTGSTDEMILLRKNGTGQQMLPATAWKTLQ